MMTTMMIQAEEMLIYEKDIERRPFRLGCSMIEALDYFPSRLDLCMYIYIGH